MQHRIDKTSKKEQSLAIVLLIILTMFFANLANCQYITSTTSDTVQIWEDGKILMEFTKKPGEIFQDSTKKLDYTYMCVVEALLKNDTVSIYQKADIVTIFKVRNKDSSIGADYLIYSETAVHAIGYLKFEPLMWFIIEVLRNPLEEDCENSQYHYTDIMINGVYNKYIFDPEKY